MNKLLRLMGFCSVVLVSSLQAMILTCEEDTSRQATVEGWYPMQLQAGKVLVQIDLPSAPTLEHFEEHDEFPFVEAWAMTGNEEDSNQRFSIFACQEEESFTSEMFKILLQLCGNVQRCNKYLSMLHYKDSYIDETSGEEIEFPLKVRMVDMSPFSDDLLCIETLSLHPNLNERSLTRAYYGPDGAYILVTIKGHVDSSTRQAFLNSAQMTLAP